MCRCVCVCAVDCACGGLSVCVDSSALQWSCVNDIGCWSWSVCVCLCVSAGALLLLCVLKIVKSTLLVKLYVLHLYTCVV